MAKAPALKIPSHEDMRKRFHELKAEIESIESKTAPIRAERDKIVNDMREKAGKLEEQYKKTEEPLYDMKMELGQLVTLLKGRTGSPPTPKEVKTAKEAAEG